MLPFTAGRRQLRKHSLFKRLSAGTWPCREWAAFVFCFFFSTLSHTSLLMSGRAIPASRYSSSTFDNMDVSGIAFIYLLSHYFISFTCHIIYVMDGYECSA